MRFARFGLVILTVALVSGCAQDGYRTAKYGSHSSPIVGGTVDTGHPAVVVIYNNTFEGGYLCTGTLIGPSAVLTAGHCTYDDLDPTHYEIYSVTDLTNDHPKWSAGATAIHPHPSYDPNQLTHDVGM